MTAVEVCSTPYHNAGAAESLVVRSLLVGLFVIRSGLSGRAFGRSEQLAGALDVAGGLRKCDVYCVIGIA